MGGGVSDQTPIVRLTLPNGNANGHQSDEEARSLSPLPGVPLGPDGHRYTDVGNADRLIAAHGDRLRYVPAWRRWLAWDGRRWQLDHDNVRVAELAKDVPRRLLEHVHNVTGDDRKKLVAHATKTESATGIANTVTMARSVPGVAVDHDDLDADPWLLNVHNGAINLHTCKLQPPDPDRLVTKLAGCAYDPLATAPTFTRFLEEIFPDPDVRAYLQRFAGYALTGDVGEQALGLWWGAGRNGKSTLLNIFAAMLGDYAVTVGRELVTVQRHEGHDTKFTDLFRARLAVCVELKEREELDASRVKALTGGDPIRARRMREDYWTFAPTHKLVVATNHRPRANADDFALWRRVHLVPFDQTIHATRVDPRLAERIIAEELPGVLAWAVVGCGIWAQERLTPPNAVTNATAGYKAEADTVGTFLGEVGLVFASGLRVPSSDLQTIHEGWCVDAGENSRTHWQKVQTRLKELGAHAKRTGSSGRFWNGVGLPDSRGGDAG
jgi:putative DNA primase/helicase